MAMASGFKRGVIATSDLVIFLAKKQEPSLLDVPLQERRGRYAVFNCSRRGAGYVCI